MIFLLTDILIQMCFIPSSLALFIYCPIYYWYPSSCYGTENLPHEHIPCYQVQPSDIGSWEWLTWKQQRAVGRLWGHLLCLWFFTEIPVAKVMVYVVLQSAGISLLKGLSSLQFIQTHTLVHYRSWSGVLELNFQGHNTVEWGRISDLHLQEDDESKSIWGSRLQLFGVMIWRLKRKDKYEGHFHWVCAHICIYERTYWAASSLLYLNTAVKGKIFLIH